MAITINLPPREGESIIDIEAAEAAAIAAVADSVAGVVAASAAGPSGELYLATVAAGEAVEDAGDAQVTRQLLLTLSSRAEAAAATIDPLADAVRTSGYATAGDQGGALYRRVVSEPAHAGKFQDAGGAWFELAERAVTPAMLGAVGDGTTNDYTALQAAITAAAALDVPLSLVGGKTYKINTGLVVGSGAVIVGDRTVTLTNGANVTLLKVNGATGVKLSGFKLLGNPSFTASSNYGIYVDWTTVAGSDVDISDIDVDGVVSSAIIALATVSTPSSGLRINGCTVTNAGGHGIIAQDYISDVIITRNYIKATGLLVTDRPGITASRFGSSVVVSDNIVAGSGLAIGTSVHGISIDGTEAAVVSGNVVYGWKGAGVEVGFVNGGSIADNTIYDCTTGIFGSGIHASSRINQNVAITGNSIRDMTGGAGINFFMTGGTGAVMHKNITIANNNVYGCTTFPSGIGYHLQFIDGLTLSGGSSIGNASGGVTMLDCINWNITGLMRISENNLTDGLKSAVSITNAGGTTATVTCTAHGYTTGDFVSIWGASPTEYNAQVAVITVTGADTFTYVAPRAALTSPASGAIKVGKTSAAGLAQSGVLISYSAIATANRGLNRIGDIHACYNGGRDFNEVSAAGLTGRINDLTFLSDAPSNPRAVNLSSGLSSNVEDRAAVYMKNGKFVIAYNLAGVVNYYTIQLDGNAAPVVTNGTTAP